MKQQEEEEEAQAIDLRYYLQQWKSAVDHRKLQRDNQLKTFIHLEETNKRCLQAAFEAWISYCRECQRDKQKYVEAHAHRELVVESRGLQGLKEYGRCTKMFRDRLALFYSRYLKRRYFTEMVKFKGLGLKAKEMGVETQRTIRHKRILGTCYDSWKQMVNLKKNKIQDVMLTLNKVLMKCAFGDLKDLSQDVTKPKFQIPSELPPRPRISSTEKRLNKSSDNNLFNFERKFVPIKTLGSMGSTSRLHNTPEKNHPLRDTHTDRNHPRLSPPKPQSSSRVCYLLRLLTLRRVELDFFDDPLFKGQQRCLLYQGRLKREIIDIATQIECIQR